MLCCKNFAMKLHCDAQYFPIHYPCNMHAATSMAAVITTAIPNSCNMTFMPASGTHKLWDFELGPNIVVLHKFYKSHDPCLLRPALLLLLKAGCAPEAISLEPCTATLRNGNLGKKPGHFGPGGVGNSQGTGVRATNGYWTHFNISISQVSMHQISP